MAGAAYKRWPGWLAMALVFAALIAIGVGRAAEPRTADQRVQAISKRIACPVCNGESVADSRAPSSDQIRANIARLVTEGQLSDDQIVTEVDSKYEQDLRLVPSGTGIDALIWVLPACAAVGGAAGLWAAFTRWRRRPTQAGPTDADRELVEAALRTDTADPAGSDSGPGDDDRP